MVDVRVVGAGPAGLMAAEVLATGGAKVTIVDHKPAPARKFLLAGRGGLNLTHSEPLERLLSRYGDAQDFLAPAIRAFSPTDVMAWSASLGEKTFVGSSGRVFPASMKSSPLLRAWLRRLASLGVTLQSATPWQGFDGTPTILAMGGASWPELGSDGAWVPIFQSAGVKVNPLRPFNARQRVDWSSFMVERFAGAPLKNIALSIGGEKSRGEIIVSRDGLEGGAVYALSRHLRAPAVIEIDLKPDLSAEDVAHRLARPRGKDSRSTYLRKVLGLSPVAIALMHETKSDSPKMLRLQLNGPSGIARAISSAGGVAREEVDADFRLRKYPNTFVVGEMLDWDAPTGGYLLQACFATAHWAARALLRNVL